MSNVSISVGAVINSAGPQNAMGTISAAHLKDQSDPTWANVPGINEWRAFMAKYLPGADLTDGGYTVAYGLSKTMLQVLQQCKGNFSRANVMKQAASLHGLSDPVLLPEITINTSSTNCHPIRAMQIVSWDGESWKLFGSVIRGE